MHSEKELELALEQRNSAYARTFEAYVQQKISEHLDSIEAPSSVESFFHREHSLATIQTLKSLTQNFHAYLEASYNVLSHGPER